jgi:hypothetical protein
LWKQEARADYGIESIKRDLEVRRLEAARLEAERVGARNKRHAELEAAIKREQATLCRLGSRPVEEEPGSLATWIWLAFFPVPVGWMVWLGALSVFSSKNETVGGVCVALLVAGFIAHCTKRENETKFETAIAPFRTIDGRIATLQAEMKLL